MGDPDLVERIGAATALEMAATGLDWAYAPTLAVVQDVRWGRTFEAFAADPELVATLGAALIRGLQGAPGSPEFLGPGKVAACARSTSSATAARAMDAIRATPPHRKPNCATSTLSPTGMRSKLACKSIMASFSSWGGSKLHGRTDLLTGLLKQHWRFDGPVIGDWNAHGQLPGCTTERCPDALLAGLDLYMAPDSWRGLYRSTLEAARDGLIPRARLDDAVRRMLRLKLRAGLFDKPKPSKRPFAGQFELLSSPQHLELAREAVRRSAVLLKNRNGVLPLKPRQRILVAGDGADDLGPHCGGWTLSWQGQGIKRSDFPSAETILDGVARVVKAAGGSIEYAANGAWTERPDAAIVVLGEEPYAEFRGDLETLDYKRGDSRDYDLIRKLRADSIPVIVVFLSGRPLWTNPALNACDAFVAAHLPGTQAGALAELLFQDRARTARLQRPPAPSLGRATLTNSARSSSRCFPLATACRSRNARSFPNCTSARARRALIRTSCSIWAWRKAAGRSAWKMWLAHNRRTALLSNHRGKRCARAPSILASRKMRFGWRGAARNLHAWSSPTRHSI